LLLLSEIECLYWERNAVLSFRVTPPAAACSSSSIQPAPLVLPGTVSSFESKRRRELRVIAHFRMNIERQMGAVERDIVSKASFIVCATRPDRCKPGQNNRDARSED